MSPESLIISDLTVQLRTIRAPSHFTILIVTQYWCVNNDSCCFLGMLLSISRPLFSKALPPVYKHARTLSHVCTIRVRARFGE